MTGLRVVFYPLPELPAAAGAWTGRRARADRPRRGMDAAEPRRPKVGADPPAKGTFVLTAVFGDGRRDARRPGQPYKLQEIARVTANTWQAEYPARRLPRPAQRGRLVARPRTSGPVHLTVTFAEPVGPPRRPSSRCSSISATARG